MTFQDVVVFLQGCRYAVVASRAADGAPQSAVVGIATSPSGEVIFDTLGDTRKAANLRRDPRVSVTAWSGERTVQLDGRADEPAGEARQRALDVYFGPFPDGRERLDWKGITHFRVVPYWVRWSDFEAKPGPVVVTFARQDPAAAFTIK